MVNRYDSPAQAQFINTYVPLPFDQMFKLGTHAKEDVDTAMKNMSTTLEKWSDFRSPSQVDTDSYYAETFDRIKPIVNRLAADPDQLKTAAGRAELFTTLNNIDYKKIGALKQSRDGLLARQKANQDLMKSGRYNPLWHDVDFSGYDTLGSGQIYNDVSPLAYSSIQELADPYVKGVQDSFLGTRGGYDYFGVTSDQISNVLDQNLTGILNTPEAQMHMNIRMRQTGETPEQAAKWFRDRAVQDTQKYVRENRTPNVFALEGVKFENNKVLTGIRKTGSGKDSDVKNPAMLTDQLEVTGDRQLLQNISANPTLFPNLTKDLSSEDSTVKSGSLAKDAQNQFEIYTGYDLNSPEISLDEKRQGLTQVLNNFSSPISETAANILLQSQSASSVKTSRGEEYVATSSKGMVLPEKMSLMIMGKPNESLNVTKSSRWYSPDTKSDFSKDLEDGKFLNITMQNDREQYSYIDKNGNPQVAIRTSVRIPVKELERVGYDSPEKLVKELGGTLLYENKEKTDEVTHVAISTVRPIPNDGTTKSWINQEYLNKQTSSTYGNPVYEQFQLQSFDLDN